MFCSLNFKLLPIFLKDIPTRQDLDKVCSDIPIYFADEEGHKALAATYFEGKKVYAQQ